MIPVWLIAAIALLGAVCLALPLHIGMTGVCLLLLAAVLLALRILRKKDAPKVWSRILIALTAVSMAVIFGAMGYISVQGKDSAMTPDETPDFIVVLGAQVQGDGPSLTLKKRLDKALEFLQAHPDRTVIVSGGQGPDEAHTEASVMAQYLLAHGADASQILEEPQASNTRENLLFSAKLAEEAGFDTSRVLIVTSEFHLRRASYIAGTLGLDASRLGSRTTPYILRLNYELREVFAPGEVDRIYLNFSDPWPPNRQRKRRLTWRAYLEVYDEILRQQGDLCFKTDNQRFFEWSLQEICQFGWLIQNISLDLHNSDFEGNVMTEYEEKFSAEGYRIYRLEACRRLPEFLKK